MSNCLDLDNCVVQFSEDEIDIPALKKLQEESKEEDSSNYNDATKYLFRWFLNRNTKFLEDGKKVEIRFGKGDSSHTFRDFRGTINVVLKPLMKKPRSHMFKARDIDMPSDWFLWEVDFQKGIERGY